MHYKPSVFRLWMTTLCALLFSAVVFAQQKTITGRILSEDGNAVIGATVSAKGTKASTLTNTEGNFSLSVPNNVRRLVISSVGFEQQEVDASNQAPVSVSLRTAVGSLNEVVVTGYSAQRKRDITGSVAVVNVSNLKQVPSGTTESLLQGQASGVTVINSGLPGGNSNVRIRGISSIGNVDPLVIVDGTPGSIHDLNVNDIESIQVLKDAGAASIYGVRGSSGVIVVTTKKGRQGKVTISYDGYYGTQRPLKNGFNIANTQENADAVMRSYINSGIAPADRNPQYGLGNTPVIPDYITPTAGKEGDPLTNPATYKLYSNQITRANKAGTDWFHEIFKPAPIQSHTVSASGGTNKSSFYYSLGYLNQQGTLIETYLKRYTARINTVFNVQDHVRFGENAFIFYRDNPQITNQNEGNAISHSYRENPIIPVYDIMGNYAGTGSKGFGNPQNPVANLKRTVNNRGNDWQAQGNVYAEVDFLKHFTARTSFGGAFDNFYYYYFSYTAYENQENNQNPNGFTEGSGFNSNTTWTNTLTYSNLFAQKHNVKVLIGSEAIHNKGRSSQLGRNNYFITNPTSLTVDPALWTIDFGDPNTRTNSGSPYDRTLYSLFGQLNYSFADKYLISGVVRRDGSSAFTPDNRFGIFPSVTGGWRISRESFFPQTNLISELKIRGGWGKLGSLSNIIATNPYTLFSQSAANSFYDLAGSQRAQFGIYPSQLGNTATTWEEDIVTNVGLDATLLKNKLEFSIEWYKKSVKNLLFQASLPASLGGASAPYINAGNIENKGIDASLTYNGKIHRDFNWNTTLTFTSYSNKVTALPATGPTFYERFNAGSSRLGAFTRLQKGQAVGAFFGYDVVGLFQSSDDVAKSPTQEGAAPGFLKYRDVNGDGKITPADRTFFGNPNPDFTAGLNIGANYKNFDLGIQLYASVGNDAINYVRYWTEFPQVFNGAVDKDAVYNSWTPSNTNAKVPILTRTANFSNTGVFNSYYLENASFLKCRNLTLGYSFPVGKLSRIRAERFRVYVQASNLFQITKYTGLDPELPTSNFSDNTNFGIDLGNYPANQKIFTFGISLGF